MKNTIKTKTLFGAGLTALAFSLILTQNVRAQTCATVPTCEELGYNKTESDCSGLDSLKCPFDRAKYFCSSGGSYDDVPCNVGVFYNSDGSCNTAQISGKTIIGVVVQSGYILSLRDMGTDYRYLSEEACESYDIGGSSGWTIPTREQWEKVTLYQEKINNALASLQENAQVLSSQYYWAEEYGCSYPCEYMGEKITCWGLGCAYRINPISGAQASGYSFGYNTLSGTGRCVKNI